jgi:hypothetical protein
VFSRASSLLPATTYGRSGSLPAAATAAADGLNKLAASAHKAGWGFEWVSGGLVAELKVRQKLLANEVDREKQRLDMLKQERDSLAEAIASRFTASPFGQQNGQAPVLADTSGMTPEERAQALATYQQQYAAYQQANSPTAILQQQLADLREAKDLEAQLRRMGLGGAALAEVMTTASIEELRALVASGAAGNNKYEHLFNHLHHDAQQFGSTVGGQVYNADIKEQTKVLHEAKEHLKALNQRVQKLEQSNTHGHQATKAAVDHLGGKVAAAKAGSKS